MASMEVRRQHEAHRIIADELLDYGITSKDLTGTIPIAAIKDFALKGPDRLLLASGLNVLHKGIEGLALERWEDIGEGVWFKEFGHAALPSTIVRRMPR
jgi:hypothetical protein